MSLPTERLEVRIYLKQTTLWRKVDGGNPTRYASLALALQLVMFSFTGIQY